jgi:hypothetical protein
MIHIIDKISFSEVTCDLNKISIIFLKKKFFNQYFRIGTTFFEHPKNNNKKINEIFFFSEQGQEAHSSFDSDKRQKSFICNISYSI